ncbi:MAG TPA: hypothetical protein VJ885_02430 [Thermoanaerobaculia bacterium]|nr:hypothetical protein [Thermoanaerobaculia bacterium]
MKKALILACTFLFVSVAGSAQTPGAALLSEEVLAMILGEPAAGAACATKAAGKGGVVYASEGIESTCTTTVFCESGSESCSGTSCAAVARDCSVLERGSVTCNGVTTLCPTACCSSGTYKEQLCCRCNATGDCFACCLCGGGNNCRQECGGGSSAGSEITSPSSKL